MKRLLTLAVATAILGLTIDSAQARPDNPAIKNGNPCIEEVCLGDEPKDLNHIKWKSFNLYNYKKIDIKAIGDPKAINTLSYYFGNGFIDSKALKALDKVKGFCSNPLNQPLPLGRINLKGIYTNKKGRDVAVSFVILPEQNGKTQKVLVDSILKTIYPQEATPEQLKDLWNQISIKYPGFNEYNAMMNTSHYAEVRLVKGSTYLNLSTYKYSSNVSNSEYRKFPGCGGDVQIKL